LLLLQMYRAFESWCGEKEWTVALPAGEEALVVAAGSSGVAVATSKQVCGVCADIWKGFGR
jgi:hypothetical protein